VSLFVIDFLQNSEAELAFCFNGLDVLGRSIFFCLNADYLKVLI